MSGGSFEYLCFQDAGQLLEAEGMVQAMADKLSELGYAKDAAKATTDVLLEIRKSRTRIEARAHDLSAVWKAVEWWVSGDVGEEELKETLSRWRGETDGGEP